MRAFSSLRGTSDRGSRRPAAAARRLRLEQLEGRLLLSTINWVNRGQASDRFSDVFGAGANAARAVIDAVIDHWERMIVDFNYPGGGNTFNLTLSMAATGTDRGGLGGVTHWTSANQPDAGSIDLGRGDDLNGDGLGDGGGYYIDPVPNDWAEFDGEIGNVFTGVAVDDGQPPIRLSDFYTLAAHEIGHCMGLVGGNHGFNQHSTNTGVVDFSGNPPNPGSFYVFQGPSIRHLVTSCNGGSDGGSATHTAHGARIGMAPAHVMYNGTEYFGALDLMTWFTPWTGRRRLIPDTLALILKDSYGYTVELPQKFGTFHAMLNETTGQLRIRGGNDVSDDQITIDSDGSKVLVSVDLGNDVPGTGALPGAEDLPAFVSEFDLADVLSIVVEAGQGSDTIHVYGLPPGVTASIEGGEGNDVVYVGGPAGNLAWVEGNVSFDGGPGTDTLTFNDAAGDFPPPMAYTIDSWYVERGGGPRAYYSHIEQLNLLGRGGGNSIDVNGAPSGTPVTIHAGNGSDTIRINPASQVFNLGETVTVNGQGGSDQLVVYDSVFAGGTTYTVTDNRVADVYGNEVLYGTMEGVTLNTGTGHDIIDVESTAPGTPVVINANGGDDTIRICPISQVFELGGAVTVNGQDGNDQLTVSDAAYPNGTSYYVTASRVADAYNNEVFYGTMEGLTLTTGPGRDVIDVDSTATGAPVTVNANDGDDTIRICPAAQVLSLRAAVTANGQNGHDQLIVSDAAYLSGTTYTVSASRVTDAYNNEVFYGTLENLTLTTGPGNDRIDVLGTPAGQTTDINAGGGNDGIYVGNGNLDSVDGDLLVRGQGGSDRLEIEDQATATSQIYIITDQNVARSAAGLTGYDASLELLILSAGTGNDSIRVEGTNPATPLTLFGGPGADSFHVEAPPASSVSIDGGDPTGSPGDALYVTGTPASQGVYCPDAGRPGEGTVQVDGRTISFTGLEPITARVFDRFTLVTPASGDILAIDEIRPGRPRISGTSGGVAFEALAFLDVATLVVDMGSHDARVPDDRLSINGGNLPAAGVDLLAIDTGTGTNTIEVHGGWVNMDASLGGAGSDRAIVRNAGTTVNFVATQRFTSLDVGAGSRVALTPGGNTALAVERLLLAGDHVPTGRLDIHDNGLIVNYDDWDASPGLLHRAQILHARDQNAPSFWTGNGITSADAAADPAIVGVEAFEATEVFGGLGGMFHGVALGPGDKAVLIETVSLTPGITLMPTSGLTTTEAGGAATFYILLDTPPAGDVSVGLSSSNPGEGTVAPASVTFPAAAWNNPQMVTVTGVDDSVPDGDVGYTIVTGAAQSSDAHYSGLNPVDVAVVNLDDDSGAAVVGRYVFYNRSAFDGNNPAANGSDDNAIAPDKTALLPGQTATLANYTSYARGINGIMVDIAGMPGVPTAADFEFRAGNRNQTLSWPYAPAPIAVAVRPGQGAGGSDRVTLLWDDYAVQKQWLQVTVLPTERTGLEHPDVFYFGNAVAEAGNSTTDAKVNATDMLLARNNPRTFLDPAPVDFPYDFNRDARVNATDMLLARNNQTHFLNELKLITVPGTKAVDAGGRPSKPLPEQALWWYELADELDSAARASRTNETASTIVVSTVPR
ncbi:MAG: hypothetical protein JXB62_12755 [Pirellulales bacterium]|nr:hypothetical protein [Pirellulales bacterium]